MKKINIRGKASGTCRYLVRTKAASWGMPSEAKLKGESNKVNKEIIPKVISH